MSKSSDVGGSPPQVDTSTLKNSSKASGPPRLTVSRFGPTEVIRQSLPVLGQDKRLLPLLITLSFVMGLIEAALVYLVVQIGVALAGGRDVFEFVLGPLALHDIGIVRGTVVGGILVVVLVLLLIPVARISGRLPARAQERVRLSLLDSYLGATWDIRARYPEGHLQELLTTYSTRAERAITQLVLGSIAICGLTAILLTAFLASPIAAVVAIACVAAVGLILSPLLARVRVASGAYADSDRSFAGRAAEIARLTPEVAAFDVASKVSEDVAVRAGDVAASFTRIRTLMRLGSSLYQYIALFLILVALGTASILVEGPELATIGGVLLLLVRALSYGQQLQGQVQQAQETGPFLELMREEIASLQAAQVDRSGTRIESPVPLEFCDVHFAYQPDSEVLKGITFDLQPGQSLGIVGRSGAGKSTIVQLLLRLRNPTSGYIRVNGHPLTEVSIARWAELVAYVPQDNKLIRGSVSDNIRFYRPALSEEAVRSAALKAHLHDEIIALPEGYDTEVGPGARDLSGGQRQRLGIARALAGEPELIVLDEPTSALDARSESLVTDTLIGLHGTVGTIVVAHRPATLAGCDQILRIEDGRAMIGSPPSTTSNFGLPATP